MIFDLEESGPEELAGYDVCVIGSGPAGMTVANELAPHGLRVCVLESGRRKTTRHGDLLRRVESEGIQIKEYSRERVLGGASSTWAGLSSPLDPIDLEERPFLRSSGWPLKREELVPYYRAAAERYRFPPLELFGPGGLDAVRSRNAVELGWRDLEEKVFLAAARPQHFGREFRHLFDRPNVDLALDATVIRLEGGPAGRRVERARVVTSGGRQLTLAAGTFVLAAGGLENARLLLNSRDPCPAGLGNDHDQVGRWLMNHPKNYFGVMRLARPVTELPYYFGCLHRGYAGYGGLRLKEELQRRQGLLNCYVRFEPLFPWSDSEGVEAFVFLAKRCRGLLDRWLARRQDDVVSLRDYAETGDDSDLQNARKSALDWLGLFGKIAWQSPRVARYAWFRMRRDLAPRIHRIRIRNFMEMEPNPENRVVLGEALDPNGQPVPVVRHDSSSLDRRSLIALHAALAAEVTRNGFGELTGDLAAEQPWPVDLDASHHMGTTRMGNDPLTSVVTPELRLHGHDNVYAAGASVFPTSGCSNPTFTIVALSIRLAETLVRSARGVSNP